MTDMTVSKTILEQLGGGKFIAMTGAKNFVGGANSLSFRLPGGAGFCKDGINGVRIVLNGRDLYDVEFFRLRGTKLTTVAKELDVYVDGLRSTFTTITGLATSLGTMGR